jgi:hypothetical protein
MLANGQLDIDADTHGATDSTEMRGVEWGGRVGKKLEKGNS